MAGSVNRVILVGNLGRDVEIRFTNDGTKIGNMSIATSEIWKDRQTGERRERTEWHRVVIYNEHLADIAERYLRKGSTVYLEGALQTRKWTDQSGVDKYTTEVVLQKFKGELVMLGNSSGSGSGDSGGYGNDTGGSYGDSGSQQSGGNGPEWNSGGGTPGGDLDDEIPF